MKRLFALALLCLPLLLAADMPRRNTVPIDPAQVGRFQVVCGPDGLTMRVDTVTGNTWHLADVGQRGSMMKMWVLTMEREEYEALNQGQ